MNWAYLLTSIDGRITRQPFWIVLISLGVIELAAYFAMGDRWSSIVGLLLTYPTFALLAKRGHDRNVPTWVAGLFALGSVVLDVIVLSDLAGTAEKPSVPFLVIGIPLGIMALILLIDFGFRRGTVGPNRYGPDPLAA